MDRQFRVLIAYGRSLLLAGLERRLSVAPHITLYHINPDNPALLSRVLEFGPEVVLLDQRDPDLDVSATVWLLLDQVAQTRILVLNASDGCSDLYERHRVMVTSLDDLVDAISAWRKEQCANPTSVRKNEH